MRSTHPLAIAATSLLLIGCSEDKGPTKPEGPYRPLTTIPNVIANLKLAYTERNLDEYANLFAGDYVTHSASSAWTLGDELDMHYRMFSGEPDQERNVATGIELAFTQSEPDIDPDFPGLTRVVLSAVDLRVETRNIDDGDVTLYITPAGTQAHLYFVQTEETDPRSGDRLWKIQAWKDVDPAGVARSVEPGSWWLIKSKWQGRYRPLTTITNVIHNLKQAYVDTNYDEYAKLFTPGYMFIFQDEQNVPDSWVLGEELEAHLHMFGGTPNGHGNAVIGIELAFAENDPDSDPQYPDYTRVILSAVDLRVDTRNMDNGDPTLYVTPAGSQAWLYFVLTEEADPRSRCRLWKIVVWKDAIAGGGRPETETTSWGIVKAIWR